MKFVTSENGIGTSAVQETWVFSNKENNSVVVCLKRAFTPLLQIFFLKFNCLVSLVVVLFVYCRSFVHCMRFPEFQ